MIRRSKISRTASVRWFVIGYITALGCLCLALAALGYVSARNALAKELDATMTARMQELTALYRDGGMPLLRQSIDRLGRRSARTFSYIVVDDHGDHLIGAPDLPSRPALGWSMISVYDRDDDRWEAARVLAIRLDNGATLGVIADRDVVDGFDAALLRASVIGTALFLVLAIVGGWAMDRFVRLRLSSIASTANDIIAGDLNHRVPISPRGDEFDEIATVINLMLDRMDALIVEVRRTSSFLAHDLRAPLIEFQRELVTSAEACSGSAGCVAILQSARERGDDLIQLFDAILRISQVSDGAFVTSTIDLSERIQTLAESFAYVAEEQGGRLLHDAILPAVMVRADHHLLNQLIVNLLDNSLRHCAPGTRIAVSLIVIDTVAHFTIENDADVQGAAIAGSAPEHRATFGLSLVRAIVASHGGTFETKRLPGRFIATVKLPVAAPAETE